MIGTIDIQCNAAHPNMQLQSLYAFLNSPSNIRIIGIPKRIGLWNIEKVYISVTYPDNMIYSVECVKNGSIWVGTIPCSTSVGQSLNGFSVTADGIDENGNEVNGYVLGKGDVVILNTDGTITEGQTTYYLHVLSSCPDTPKKGDVYVSEGIIYLYDGITWSTSLTNEALSNFYTKSETSSSTELSNKFQNYYTKSETSSIEELNDKFEHLSVDLSEYYTKSETSSAAELSDKFAHISVDLSEYYTKSETSSAIQLSNTFNNISSDLSIKRDISNRTWKWTMDNDTTQFGIDTFTVVFENQNYILNYDPDLAYWINTETNYTIAPFGNNMFEFQDNDGSFWEQFIRTSEDNLSWSLGNGLYQVTATKRADDLFALETEIKNYVDNQIGDVLTEEF